MKFLGLNIQISPDHRSDTWVFITYWIFASPIILSGFNTEVTASYILLYYCYMIIAYSSAAWIIINVLFPSYMPSRKYGLGFIGLLIILILTSIGSEIIDVIIYTKLELYDSSFSWESIWKHDLPNDAQNILTIVAILAGKKYFDERQRNTALELERRQSELSRLRAQVDPHFLFNSLNILDILIEDDPKEAKQFVHRLSNLYRYLIRHRDEDLVAVSEELTYAQDYHYLVERRFGNSFPFRADLDTTTLKGYYIPPGSLQTVLENVYKHNLATERNPVTITIEQRGDAIFVTNDYVPKPGGLATHEQSGSGTKNLLRRYSLLTDNEVYARRENDQWIVRLPILKVDAAISQASLPATPSFQVNDRL